MITDETKFNILISELDKQNKLMQEKYDNSIAYNYDDLQKYSDISKQIEKLIQKEEV